MLTLVLSVVMTAMELKNLSALHVHKVFCNDYKMSPAMFFSTRKVNEFILLHFFVLILLS